MKRSLHIPRWLDAQLNALRAPGMIGHRRSYSNLVVLLVERALLELNRTGEPGYSSSS